MLSQDHRGYVHLIDELELFKIIMVDGIMIFPIWRPLVLSCQSYEEAKEYNRNNQQYGWKRGLNNIDYEIKFIDRPSYLIPLWMSDWWSLYKILLRVSQVAPFSLVDDIILNIYILFMLLINRPNFIFLSDARMLSEPVDRLCEWLSCDVIDFFGDAPANTTKSRRQVPYEVDYVVTGYPLSRLYPNLDDRSILEIRQGPPKSFQITEDERRDRNIDVLIFGSFDNKIFHQRCKIIEKFLSMIDTKSIEVLIIGDIRQDESVFAQQFPNLASHIDPSRGGKEFRDTLYSAKLSICIPSDQHIEVDAQRPKAIFECAAAGVMQLHYNVAEVEEIFHPKDEIIQFTDADDLVRHVEQYLDHEAERAAIAERALDRYKQEYTAENQIGIVFSDLYND